MLTIKAYLDRSAIHGMGVFSAQNVKKGDIVWRFAQGFDRFFTQEQFKGLPAFAQLHVRKHSYGSDKGFVLEGDYGQFLNHSDTPNMIHTSGDEMVAARDIAKGEEMTCDYNKTDSFAVEKLEGDIPQKFWRDL